MEGHWIRLIEASEQCDDKAAVSRRRFRRRVHDDDLEKRVARAELLCHLGELSSARQALEGATLAPGNSDTLDQLKDPTRRPPRPREPLPHDVVSHVPGRAFELDEQLLSRNLRSVRRGAAAGPSGMTTEHLRLLCSDMRTLHVFFQVAEKFARGEIPESVVKMVKLGRMTALSRPDGRVRGIVTGDVVRRLVARTMAQQLGKAVEAATSPHQYALSTKAGCECIAHILQGLTDADERATVISVDGVSAFDLISRGAMMQGLMRVDGGSEAVPFVRMFYGSPSEYLWEDSLGVVHTIPQGEGGEQGDPLMPLLFAVGQHQALEAVKGQLSDGDHLLAYLDDTFIVTQPESTGDSFRSLETELWNRAKIRIHGSKTKIWNRAGIRPPICDELERRARAIDPSAIVWRGSEVPCHQQGLKVLGTPLGHPEFVRQFLEKVTTKHDLLLSRIPAVHDLQSAWLILLHCAAARANFLLRVVSPDLVEHFAHNHDHQIWECLARILDVDLNQCEAGMKASASLPLSMGG